MQIIIINGSLIAAAIAIFSIIAMMIGMIVYVFVLKGKGELSDIILDMCNIMGRVFIAAEGVIVIGIILYIY